jgi:DNA-binding LacI/PurR family transcriptional regulator
MSRAKNPTMAEVAAVAGVSHQTVSRVINGSSEVRQATRERVEAAIDQLGYRRNRAARALVTNRSGLIGVITVGAALYGPTSALTAIEESARSHGYLTLFASVTDDSDTQFRSVLDDFLDHAVEAVVVIAAREPLLDHAAAATPGVPLVVIGPRPGQVADALCLNIDQDAGGRLAVEHLVGLGHRRIALLHGPERSVDAEQRQAGALAACAAHGVRPTEYRGDWSVGSGYLTGSSIVALPDADRPTAVVAANDQMALGLMAAFREHGTAVPDDISVVGFDDAPEAAYYSPPLTSVRQDFRALGALVVDTLLDCIRGGSPAPSLLAPTLTVRASTAPPTGRAA